MHRKPRNQLSNRYRRCGGGSVATASCKPPAALQLAALLTALLAAPPLIADQRDERLPPLFGHLAEARVQSDAIDAAQQIWTIWTQSGDEEIDAQMQRGAMLMQRGRFAEALEVLDAVVEARPQFAEGWNRRATVHYMARDYAASMADIQRTLVLEPRHFGALSGMGLIFKATGDPEAALSAFEEVLRIHPWAPAARAERRRLRSELGISL